MTTNNTNNNASPNIAAHSVMLSQGASNQTGLLLTAGQVAIGTTSSDPAGAQITGSGNVTVTSSTGAIAISLTGTASFVWNAQATTPVTASVNNGYIITDASAVTLTLPAIAAVGSVVSIVGDGAGGWIMTANTGQTIKLGNQTTSSGGTISSTNQYDCIEVICIVANTTWVARNFIGNLTYA